VEAVNLGYPKFVKIDVESAEGYVLQAAPHYRAARPVLFVECSDAGSRPDMAVASGVKIIDAKSAFTGKALTAFEQYRHSDLPLAARSKNDRGM